MYDILISNANIVNEGKIVQGDVLIKHGRIEKIGQNLTANAAKKVIDAQGKYLFPGLIDDQVHFREPGLTHKANIYTEAKSAVAGGVTSFMEMPNTRPAATTLELLEEKFAIGQRDSLANYSFFLGANNFNLEVIKNANPASIAGIKIFMGSSTGDLLVDDRKSLEAIFAECPMLIATHCEDDPMIKANLERYKLEFGGKMDATYHPKIRSAEACYQSSSYAVSLAKKHGTRLHILHISTAKELELFENRSALNSKKITAEACIHHLWFTDSDYAIKGNYIKWNPAIKTAQDRDAIFGALLDGRIDVIATDHAPHTIEEKALPFLEAPSGGPLVQHSLVALLDFYHQGKISLEKIAEKTAHNVATIFGVRERGFIREGYFADLALVDLQSPWTVSKDNILSMCGWSPFEGHRFQSKVTHTLVNGHLAYENGLFDESQKGKRLEFER
jgi:dihydroorotase